MSNSTLLEYVFRVVWVSASLVLCFWTEWTLQRHRHSLKGFFFSWIPSGWLIHKGNFCKWGNPSGISAAPSPNNTVGSSHCGMLGSLWLVYRVYRILCCLWNVVVGNLLCNSWNTIPSEVISGTQQWCDLTTVFLLSGAYLTHSNENIYDRLYLKSPSYGLALSRVRIQRFK